MIIAKFENLLIRISNFALKNNILKISASFFNKSTSFKNLLKKSKITLKNLYSENGI